MKAIPRKLLFSVVVVSLVLALGEGVAMLIEPYFFPQERSIPLPLPGLEPDDSGLIAIAQANEELKKNPPQWREGIPMEADEALGWALPKDAEIVHGDINVRTNSLGLRGAEIPNKNVGEWRLLSIGDSSIFGHGVPEEVVFSTEASRRLSTQWGKVVTPINGGTPGHDSGQSLRRLKQLLPQVQPDIVVIGNLWSDVFAVGAPVPADAYHFVPPVQDTLRSLASYRIMRQIYSPFLNRQKVGFIGSNKDIGDSSKPGSTRVSISQYYRNLKEMAELSIAARAHPVFLVLPAPMDMDKVPPPESVQQYRFVMEKVALEFGAPLVNGPALFKKEDNALGYFSDAVHPSAEGHLLLGKLVAEQIEKQAWGE